MVPIEPLGLSANQWQFLSKPKDYADASGGKLRLECLERQFRTASDILRRLNGSFGEKASRGILLADDAGLGKTTVAALVAWVAASDGRKVRILAPNDVMVRRWTEELASHVGPCRKFAPKLDVRTNRVVGRRPLTDGLIQVVKHSHASASTLKCDLLIIDEAHRAKGKGTDFSKALKKQKKFARRILILTATPFSIRLEELNRMLSLVGGDEAHSPVRSFSHALDALYSGETTQDPVKVADGLSTKAQAAVDKMRQFVIRNSIDGLPREHDAFGKQEAWSIEVPRINELETELILRMGRARRVVKHADPAASNLANDSRFDVGWRHFDHVGKDLNDNVAPHLSPEDKALVCGQLKWIRELRKQVGGVHSKMKAVGVAVQCAIGQNEKVLLFCHHHATAQELTIRMESMLQKLPPPPECPSASVWKAAWEEVLAPAEPNQRWLRLRDTFIDWLSSELVRAQTWSWVPTKLRSKGKLAHALKKTRARGHGATIDFAAQSLYHSLRGSPSSRAVLKAAGAAGRSHLDSLPGANGKRVLGVCDPDKTEASLFMHNKQPDTVISIFNSPFGPDVLVVTDKLSEGVDLHRYCRHLIHYELDPSPIRTMQRNGRVRRVNSWASVSGKPIRYAYPAFGGTRDELLVQIMKKRIESFSLLLGGAQDFDVEKAPVSDEKWRSEVMAKAKKRLAKAGGKLRTRDR